MLLMRGADPNNNKAQDPGMTPLLMAAACKSKEGGGSERGGSERAGEGGGPTVVSYSQQCAPIVVKLLRAGADAGAHDTKGGGRTALHMVIEAGQVEIEKVCALSHGE